ncbi:MAG TPA: hypothetical protein VHE34_03405 [Puia sp.]|nr:hypothetical protein [Puia sp.]HVU94239.1 hypothetical protein [Puia sp.]
MADVIGGLNILYEQDHITNPFFAFKNWIGIVLDEKILSHAKVPKTILSVKPKLSANGGRAYDNPLITDGLRNTMHFGQHITAQPPTLHLLINCHILYFELFGPVAMKHKYADLPADAI